MRTWAHGRRKRERAMVAHELRLATRANGTRDGELVLVSRSLSRCAPVPAIARTLQAALDDWGDTAPKLAAARARWDASGWLGAEPFDPCACLAPLPRAYQWADASV